MSQRKSRAPSGSDDSSGPRIPPVPQGGRGRRSGDDFGSPKRRRRHSGRGYDMPREKPLPSKVELQLCVFHGAPSHRWRTAPFTFDRRRDDDRDLWEEIRHIYRDELQGYTPNGVPIPKAAKDDPNSHSFMHAIHHPDRLRPAHDWVDWFTEFKASDRGKPVGLEFQEGLWAEKFAIIAILITIAIIIVSIVWVVRGGQLQTVFTVMGFVLSGAAAELALVALYFQLHVQSPVKGSTRKELLLDNKPANTMKEESEEQRDTGQIRTADTIKEATTSKANVVNKGP
ncbi:MAG: hypothetical protein ASARMPRED_003171 [Alectoria sarmentosa]|nr:MAG: hypothetical protein ASARMPRED_003171 [Alectoria sarmentosa]